MEDASWPQKDTTDKEILVGGEKKRQWSNSMQGDSHNNAPYRMRTWRDDQEFGLSYYAAHLEDSTLNNYIFTHIYVLWVMEESRWGCWSTMLMCFGSRRRARHQQEVQWSEEDCLLDDEPQLIANPCFLDTGTVKADQTWLLTTSWRPPNIFWPFCSFSSCSSKQVLVSVEQYLKCFQLFPFSLTQFADKSTKGKMHLNYFQHRTYC